MRFGIPLALACGLIAGSALALTAPVKRSPDIADCGAEAGPDDLCRIAVGFDAAEAARRLGADPLAYWISGQTLNIAARWPGDALKISGTIEEGLTPLSEGPSDRFWGGSYRLAHMADSLLEVRLGLHPAQGPTLTYRGPQAPKATAVELLPRGRTPTVELDSQALGAPRKVTLYLPPAPPPATGYPVIYMADGQMLDSYIPLVDALIRRGVIRPVMLVGAWFGVDPAAPTSSTLRQHEFLKRQDPAAYGRHEAFILDEVVPLAEGRYHASGRPQDRMLFGFSNGADWALTLAADHPGFAGNVAAFSRSRLSDPRFEAATAPRLFLEAGRYEPAFFKPTEQLCRDAQAAGVTCRFAPYYAGHDTAAWQAELAKVLVAVFGA